MGLSRRKFTTEFKAEVMRRLELGASVAEVARACELNPNVLHRWRRERRENGKKAFPGWGQRRAEESRVAELERKIGQQAWEIDFCDDACSGSKSSGNCRRQLEGRCLRADRARNEGGPPSHAKADVPTGASEPSGVLPSPAGPGASRLGHGIARRSPAPGPGDAQLRLAPDHGRIAASELESKPQTSAAPDAGGQPALSSA